MFMKILPEMNLWSWELSFNFGIGSQSKFFKGILLVFWQY